MSIEVKSFMGRTGFLLRKYMPHISSYLYIRLLSIQRNKKSQAFIESALQECEKKTLYPTYIAIETVNRCNGTCPFCPANINDEIRPYQKMDIELFHKLVSEIAAWKNWDGFFSLYVNNEPFIDNRMVGMLREARRKLPLAKMLVFTNGSLLTPQMLKEISQDVDHLIINNYNSVYKLNEPVQKVYDYVKKHPDEFKHIEIVIQKRYANEYLTNRAGAAPNKKVAAQGISQPCLMPFTDLTIYPDGQVGLCCSDALETMDFGNINNARILDIYNGEEFNALRRKMSVGRKEIPICANCDFIDSGIRLNMINRKL